MLKGIGIPFYFIYNDVGDKSILPPTYEAEIKGGIMKLFHISDLHIGKQLHLYDIAPIQRAILNEIVEKAKQHRPDAIVIAGDIYDKSAPSGEAFHLFDEFLNALADIKPMIPVLIIAGNHDNHLRLNYASSFLEKHQIYISTSLPKTPEEHLKKIVLKDEYGTVNFYMLPFTRPADGKNLFGDEKEIHTYEDAVRAIIEREEIDETQRNILIAHQFFVKGEQEPQRRESELKFISIGGIDSVDIDCVKNFDYVALGHIHSSQSIGSPHIRYSGTPLKYSVSEAGDTKSITVAHIKGKREEIDLSFLPLEMKPDIRKIKGTLDEIIQMAKETDTDDFVSIVLTDEKIPYKAKERLQEFYSRILEISVENVRTESLLQQEAADNICEDPIELFKSFYQEMNQTPMSEQEQQVLTDIINTCSKS